MFLSAALLVFGAASPSLGATYYVDGSGLDSNGGSSGAPWLTIQHAVDTVAAGDTILVRAGTYAGARIELSGQPGLSKTLKAETSGTVILNAPGASQQHNGIIEIENFSGTVRYWVVDGFEVDGVSKTYRGIDIRETEHVTITGNTVHDTVTTGIFDSFSYYNLYAGNTSHDNGEHGIYHSNSGDFTTIRGNTCYNNTSCDIHMNGDLSMGGDGIESYCIIEKNTGYGAPSGAALNMDGVSDSIVRF